MDPRGVDEVLFDGDLAPRGRRIYRTADDGKVPDGHGGSGRIHGPMVEGGQVSLHHWDPVVLTLTGEPEPQRCAEA